MISRHFVSRIVLVCLVAVAQSVYGQDKPDAVPVPEPMRTVLDIPYAGTENPRQRLDLYVPTEPTDDRPLPVVIIIHGQFQNADKKSGLGFASSLVPSGDFAAVAIGYRLSDEAHWPAQIHDCKAAVRWVRANARKYNLNGDRIGAIGPSAGGHLAALLGTTGEVAELEGTLGDNLKMSSRVNCVVDLFGPTDLLSLGGNHNRAGSPESRLLGGPLLARPELAKQASPTTHVTEDDPPFLLIHGAKDPTVPFEQSAMLARALKDAHVEALLVPVEGGLHGNFRNPEVQRRYFAFFEKHLRGEEVEISIEAIPVPTK